MSNTLNNADEDDVKLPARSIFPHRHSIIVPQQMIDRLPDMAGPVPPYFVKCRIRFNLHTLPPDIGIPLYLLSAEHIKEAKWHMVDPHHEVFGRSTCPAILLFVTWPAYPGLHQWHRVNLKVSDVHERSVTRIELAQHIAYCVSLVEERCRSLRPALGTTQWAFFPNGPLKIEWLRLVSIDNATGPQNVFRVELKYDHAEGG
ncbi:hypothetical protein AcW1_005199 [Taiwanofungus camphoratus]|nr:hypothetical protein AcW2_003969 [Antrodia cinnamomea]KAI0933363.1 hypothetical protein AcV5_005525 [Antrodia cinnamomea]KAI0948857.1 hypothetical protein AcV7_009488 [Antrodia cinnamomea]KAI0956546.1 hypothetical protein AcW1_005199 [Antrodia cinnamomea]